VVNCLCLGLAEVADNTYRDAEADLNNTEASFIGDGGVSTDCNSYRLVQDQRRDIVLTGR
jgi:hypothetical protein